MTDERCPHCSFSPTSLNDYCEKHRPTMTATELVSLRERLETMEQQNNKLREALKWIARQGECDCGSYPSCVCQDELANRAAAALVEAGNE